MTLVVARRRLDGRIEQGKFTGPPQARRKFDILHQWNGSKAAQPNKDVAPDENTLIAVQGPTVTRSPSGH